MSRSQSPAKREPTGASVGRLTASEFGEEGLLELSLWSLDDPSMNYSADAARYRRTSVDSELLFAQTLGDKAATAVSVRMPTESVRMFLHSLASIRQRLKALNLDVEPPLELTALHGLDGQSFAQLRVDLIRACSSDHTAALDFYRLPRVSPERVAAAPDMQVEITPVMRVELAAGVLWSLTVSMEESES